MLSEQQTGAGQTGHGQQVQEWSGVEVEREVEPLEDGEEGALGRYEAEGSLHQAQPQSHEVHHRVQFHFQNAPGDTPGHYLG